MEFITRISEDEERCLDAFSRWNVFDGKLQPTTLHKLRDLTKREFAVVVVVVVIISSVRARYCFLLPISNRVADFDRQVQSV